MIRTAEIDGTRPTLVTLPALIDRSLCKIAHFGWRARLCENASEPKTLRIVFSITLRRQHLPVRLVFRSDEIEMEILGASSASEFSHSLANSDMGPRNPPLTTGTIRAGIARCGNKGLGRMCNTAVKRPVVLVVEDDFLIRIGAVEMIEGAEFDVVEAANADEAMEILKVRLDITVVFTDVQMPGSMDGLKLAAAIRGRWPPIKIVAT